MSTTPESVEVKLTRIEEKLGALAEKFDGQAKTEAQLRADIAASREESRREASAVRVDLERQVARVAEDLAAHVIAVNPHPQQEEWLRRHIDRLVIAIDSLRSDLVGVREQAAAQLVSALTPITTDLERARGAGRVLWPAAAAFLGVAGGAIGTKLFS